MQQIKTFRAASMQEALDLVRAEVGPDAMILHTKQVSDRSILPWKKTKQEVEVTVALEEEPASSRLSQSISRTYQADSRPEEEPEEQETRRPARRPAKSTKSLAMQLLDQIGQDEDELQLTTNNRGTSRLSAQPTRPAPTSAQAPRRENLLNRPLTPAQQKSFQTRSEAPVSEAVSEPARRPQTIAARSRSEEQQTPPTRPTRPEATLPRPARQTLVNSAMTNSKPEVKSSLVDNNFANRLANIERMLMSLGRHNPLLAMHELPNSLFNLYTKLIDKDVAEEVARELVFDIKKQCRRGELEVEGQTDALLEGLLEKQFQCCGPIQVTQGRRKIVALVGATGVGKTTTIAKLAANFKLRQGLKMGLVTVDTYRIAAVEQLRTYAEIMELPMKVVTNTQEMRQALDELQGLDLVLIDTGGRSPKDEPKIQELKSLLQEARADEVHLVLNLTASLRSLESMANEFSVAGTTAMILTKLDETEGLGPMLNLARKVSLPVSYLTTGQAVPEDIEPASASRMRRLLLEQETLGQLAGNR